MNILDTIKSQTQKAQFETDRYMRIQHIQRDAKSLQRKIQQIKLKLGSTAYNMYKDDELAIQELTVICENIVSLETEIETKENEVDEVRKEISPEYLDAGQNGQIKETSLPSMGDIGEVFSGYKVSSTAAILVVMFFFTPWVFASCSMQSIGSFSGWQLAAGTTYETAFGLQNIPGTPVLFIILLAALGVLAFAYSYWKRKLLLRWDSAGILTLGLLPLALLLYFFYGAKEAAAKEGISIEYMYGLWGAILGYIAIVVGGVLNWRERWKAKKQSQELIEK